MVSLMPIECTKYLYDVFGQEYQALPAEEQIILSTAYLEEKVSNTRFKSFLYSLTLFLSKASEKKASEYLLATRLMMFS